MSRNQNKSEVENGEVPGEEGENQERLVGNDGDEEGERRTQRYQGVADPCCYCHRLLPPHRALALVTFPIWTV